MTEISYERLSSDYLTVNSCGRQHLYKKDTGSFRPNGRIDYHILYISEGRCFVTINGKTEEAGAGSVVVFLPKQAQDYKFYKTDESVSYYVHFSGTACNTILKELSLCDKNIYYIGKSLTLERVFNSMIDEYRKKLKYNNYRMSALLLDILALIGRKKSNMLYGNPDINKQFSKICNLMAADYSKNISIKEYAKICNLSESRFSHRFTEIIGMGPKQYIMLIRIEAAKELLSDTDLSVLEISEKIGISDQNYFSRIFKKYTKLSPTEYRYLH